MDKDNLHQELQDLRQALEEERAAAVVREKELLEKLAAAEA